MKSKTKKVVLILGGSGAALVMAVIIFVLTFDINSYKSRIEAAASTASGMKVRVNGKMKLSVFPVTSISIEDILIQNKDADVASVKKAEVEIRLLPLLRREVYIQQVRLDTPSLFITKDKSGRFNFETAEKKLAPTGPFEMKKIFIKGGRALYLDEKSGGKVEAKDCDLSIQNLSSGRGESFSALSFDGYLSCGEVKAQELKISDVRVDMKVRGGKFDADPFTMKIFGGNCRGSIKGMMTGESREYAIDLVLTKFRFEEVLETFKQKKNIHGELDLKSHLTAKGKTTDEMKRTAQGEISLRGQALLIKGIDIDRTLEKYDKSQHFNLVDLGAFLIAGPLVGTMLIGGYGMVTPLESTLLAKGYDFGSAYTASLGGESTIRKLVSDWEVKNGISEAQDVAFTTSKNRIALKGKLNFVHDRFEDVTVAVLNADGCAAYSQTISGSFNKPKIDKPNIFRSLMGPAISLATKSYEMLKGGKCEIFYRGSLAQP